MGINDILGGLQAALGKGESLKQAMMTFYRAGYKRQDIERAARELQMIQAGQQVSSTIPQKVAQTVQAKPQPTTQVQKPTQSEQPSTLQNYKPMQKSIKRPFQQIRQRVSAYGQVRAPKPPQKISNYMPKPQQTESKKTIIIILIFLLLILVGALVSVFLFKEEVIEFLGKLF